MKTFNEFITEARALTPARMRAARLRMGGSPMVDNTRPLELADTKTSINKTGDMITPEHDRAYQTLKRTAPELHKFITQETPVPLDPIMTLQFHNMAGGGNQFRTIGMLKHQLRADAQKTWGNEHPAVEG